MQLIHATLLPLLSLLSLTAAAGTCTSSGSLSWPPVGDCSTTAPRYDTLVKNCRACCLNDAVCFQACLKAGGLRKRDSIGEQFYGTVRTKRELGSRAIALSCDTGEDCYKFTDGSLLCLSLGTGLYHDDVGGHGDYYSGEYTGPDGKVQTGTSVATASSAKSSPTASPTITATAPVVVTSAGATSASRGTAAASASAAAAHALSPIGGSVFSLGANVGLVGIVAGLVI